ncbi:hypothetical protein SprV_0401480800 [Sparganum proliferum]
MESNDIRPLLSKVADIREFRSPTSKRYLQQFLGMVNFYCRFLPNRTDTIFLLTSLLVGSKCTFVLRPEALTLFEQVKALVADATILAHCNADSPISLMVDACNVAVDAVLQQSLPDSTVPLAFLSRKLSKAETRYSTFGRELLAAYLAVTHFRHLLESREFTIFSDHKPLTFALHSHSGKLNHWKIRHVDYIFQFTSDTRHIDGPQNEVTDAMSRPSIAHLLSLRIDIAKMAVEQHRVASLCDDVSELQLQELPLKTENGTILCYVPTLSHRPFVSPSFRRNVFSFLHKLSHPGSRATDKLVSDHFVWSGMHKDLKAWTRARIACRRSYTRIRTTAYGPAACGVVERSHRQLKTSLRVADDPENRADHFPLILLGIRSALKPDLDCSAAEMVFGATVQLPGGMILPTPRGAVEHPTNLLHRLRQFIGTLPPVPPGSSSSQSHLEEDLATCSHVYLRCLPNATSNSSSSATGCIHLYL